MTSVDRGKSTWTTGAALAALVFFTLAGCGSGTVDLPHISAQGNIMGTQWHVRYLDTAAAAKGIAIQVFIEQGGLAPVAHGLSTYAKDSVLTRFNSDTTLEALPLSATQYDVFRIALAVCDQTGGAFDPTVSPLVERWGFGPEDPAAPPSPEVVATLLESVVGCDKVTLDIGDNPSTAVIRKAAPGVRCDLSGVAKGYTVDMVAKALAQVDVENYMIEIGGEVRTKGVNPQGAGWRIGIEVPDPELRAIQRVVLPGDRAMATSGDYRNFRIEDGKRLSHIIDPRSGYPIDHTLASVSVLHDECAWADAYATALMVLGPEAGYAFAVEHGLDVFMVIHDGDGFIEKMTPGFEARLLEP